MNQKSNKLTIGEEIIIMKREVLAFLAIDKSIPHTVTIYYKATHRLIKENQADFKHPI